MRFILLILFSAVLSVSALNAGNQRRAYDKDRNDRDAFRDFEDEIEEEEEFDNDDVTLDNIFEEERVFDSNLYNTNNDFRHRPHHHCHQSHHSFASAFSDTSQIIHADIVTPINCPANQAHTPQRIRHPYKEDNSAFEIGPSGIYEISWSLILSNPKPDTAVVEILADKVALQPTQTETLDTNGQRTVSGTIIVYLKKNTILQLAVTSTAGGLVVNSPIFTICDK